MTPNSPLEPNQSVETQLALLRQEVGQVKDILEGRGADHEARLRKLEQFKWVLLGTAMASGPIWAGVAQTVSR